MSQRLTASEIAGYAYQAGFRGAELTQATAIALAESGGNPDAVGDTDIDPAHPSIGLWQIFTQAHPDLAAKYNLADPLQNAQAAFEVSDQGKNFQPWSTFTNGAFAQFMAQAESAINNIKMPNVSIPLPKVSDIHAPQIPAPPPIHIDIPGAGGIFDVFNKLSDATKPKNLWRYFFIGVGVVLIIGGVILYFKDEVDAQMQQVANSPQGKAATTAAIAA